MHFSPFFGHYARSGGRGTGDSSSTDSQFGTGATNTTQAPTIVAPAPTSPGKKDKGAAKKKFNPDLYESPPQPPPAAQKPAPSDPGGGAPAPTP
jgi:hypothetical protein